MRCDELINLLMQLASKARDNPEVLIAQARSGVDIACDIDRVELEDDVDGKGGHGILIYVE